MTVDLFLDKGLLTFNAGPLRVSIFVNTAASENNFLTLSLFI
ncbi:MAG: hypothetical protein SPL17_09385 [Bacteroidales bacterium]|nr:hypothetical protein [Bacteroidales bacterium]